MYFQLLKFVLWNSKITSMEGFLNLEKHLFNALLVTYMKVLFYNIRFKVT